MLADVLQLLAGAWLIAAGIIGATYITRQQTGPRTRTRTRTRKLLTCSDDEIIEVEWRRLPAREEVKE